MLTMFTPAAQVVPLLAILSIAVNVSVVVRSRKHLELRSLWPMIVAGVAFTPVGAWGLSCLDNSTIQIAVGVTCGFAVALFAGLALSLKYERIWMIPIGALSGLLGGAVSLNGPPVVVFLAAQKKDKHSFRAKLAGYFLVLSLVIVPSHAVAGLIDWSVIRLAAYGLTPLLAGVWLGIWLSERVSEKLFRRLVLVIILASGAMALISGGKGIVG